ncbi:sensor histidine kinase [Vulcaniibacterium tengchongense]|uniref:histidine kinase n=1 Tax=Vulcaniibacterium tengchongense TaxID=1273429 RepID=A0A3N4UZA1_9GAMM|nr:HAMP domain-containing sensor histidine kinase [Vulcaniibacterium tengchongense]RPE75468.1 signal transduction histidine kinase [Vulcaniibacterium tengchongense]
MAHGLPRRIKLAFTVHAVIGGIAITIGILLAAFAVREWVIHERLQQESEAFWRAHRENPRHPPPLTRALTGYALFEGADQAPGARRPPESLRELPAGLHSLSGGRMVLVDRRAEGSLYLVFSSWMVDRAVLLTAAASLLLSLLTSGILVWLTYRTSKRLVAPVSWLANQVANWDPRHPDARLIAPRNLPTDAGDEVRKLSRALSGLAERVGDFVQRERNFTRDASHELRTPLTVIRVATDLMLADAETTPRQQRSLLRVQRAGRDMEAVIDAFLILAREAEVEPQSQEFDVREVVDGEIERVRPLLAERPVTLRLHDEGAPRLVAPPHVLRVVIGNLLGNAVRFTDEGSIEVRLLPDRVVIRDTGIGMSADVLAKAFDPFFRADHNAEDGGKGMGLSIVRRLADRFGWTIGLTSEPGRGTTAVVRFAR